jgi:hypothetical protein
MMAVLLQHYEAEEVEQVALRDRYNDQVKDVLRPERQQVDGVNDERTVRDALE